MNEEVTALIQAQLVALMALFATHPEPQKLRASFEGIAERTPHESPLYQDMLNTLRKAIPPH